MTHQESNLGHRNGSKVRYRYTKTFLFNLSLLKGVFSRSAKESLSITPVFKCGDKCEFTNYMPISVLSVFSKLFERIVYKRTIELLDKHSIVNKHQYGFRRDYSTCMALTSLSSKVIDAFEANEFAI